MCPVRALALWWKLTQEMGIDQHGYIFRKRFGYDRLSQNAEDGMVSFFKLILLEILY